MSAEQLAREREAAHAAVTQSDALLRNLRPVMRDLAAGRLAYDGRFCGYCYGPIELEQYSSVDEPALAAKPGFIGEMERKGYGTGLLEARYGASTTIRHAWLEYVGRRDRAG